MTMDLPRMVVILATSLMLPLAAFAADDPASQVDHSAAEVDDPAAQVDPLAVQPEGPPVPGQDVLPPAPTPTSPELQALCASTAPEDRRDCRRERKYLRAEAREREARQAWARVPRSWFWLGADVGIAFIGSRIPYRGRAVVLGRAIDGNVDDMDVAAAAPILRQTLQVHRFVAIELSERFWTHELAVTFPGSAGLDYRLRRSVVPITLSARAVFESRHAGFSMGVGPGLYIVQSTQSGHLGTGDSTGLSAGVHAFVALLIRPSPRLPMHLSFELAYDWFRMPRFNPLLQDGGDAGTVTASLGAAYRF